MKMPLISLMVIVRQSTVNIETNVNIMELNHKILKTIKSGKKENIMKEYKLELMLEASHDISIRFKHECDGFADTDEEMYEEIITAVYDEEVFDKFMQNRQVKFRLISIKITDVKDFIEPSSLIIRETERIY